MPELPEVETTIRGLKSIVGSKIINIKINTPKLRYFIPKSILLINSVRIRKIKRKGKFIIFYLQNKHSIVFHLGMSGRLRFYKKIEFSHNKHDHFLLEMNNGRILIFNDPRRFGFIDYDLHETIESRKYLTSLGIDALSIALDGPYLFFKISKSIVPIKQILLNQTIIAGIGNIYASEILFNAKISPLKRGKDLKLYDCDIICQSTKKILKKAINSGGSTLRDFVATDGTLGSFQNNFKVYNREGKKISGKIVKKIIQYGRSTYFCPLIQKNN